jgi:hypothetical protein
MAMRRNRELGEHIRGTFLRGEFFMSEFTFLFRGREYFASPSEGQKHIEQWVAWFTDLGDQGRLKDPGHPLEKGGQVVLGKDRLVKDGPYAEAKDVIGGYSIVEAENLEQAVELAKGCPILAVGGSVEVRPLLKF